MQVREELRIGRPADDVWAAFTQPDRVFGCIPGARYRGRDATGAHLGSVKLGAGPVPLILEASIDIVSTGLRTAVADVRAVEGEGRGRARGTIEIVVEDRGLFSMVRVSADLTVSGSIAAAARGGYLGEAIQETAAVFAECLERSFGIDGEAVGAEPEPAGEEHRSLLARLWDGLRRR